MCSCDQVVRRAARELMILKRGFESCQEPDCGMNFLPKWCPNRDKDLDLTPDCDFSEMLLISLKFR